MPVAWPLVRQLVARPLAGQQCPGHVVYGTTRCDAISVIRNGRQRALKMVLGCLSPHASGNVLRRLSLSVLFGVVGLWSSCQKIIAPFVGSLGTVTHSCGMPVPGYQLKRGRDMCGCAFKPLVRNRQQACGTHGNRQARQAAVP